jgi:putative DNA primase/helicase
MVMNETNILAVATSEVDFENKTLFTATSHDDILQQLEKQVKHIDFQFIVYGDNPDFIKSKMELEELKKATGNDERIKEIEEEFKEEYKIKEKHYLIITIEQMLLLCQENKWDMCRNNGSVYINNGAYWKAIDKEGLQKFFGKVAESMGVPRFTARYFPFRDALLKQFLATAHLPRPRKNRDKILLNFQNGTLEITPDQQFMRNFDKKDFLTYQLPFDYNPSAKYPIWDAHLNKVLPDSDKSRQKVLAEYFASVFINNKTLKLEKVLMLLGTGSNGKGVVFEVMTALFGSENVSNYSLQSLTDETGYYRAMIVDMLLNYSSENGAKINSEMF